MKFKDTFLNKEMRYSLGQELESKKFYVSIPVSNSLVDYEEYYEVNKVFHDSYPSNIDEVEIFVQSCRNQLQDSLLIVKPGRDRGVA
ncbi:MAG: hypothetical protein COA90_09175 [Gammaproteobacteria bacterium]|nr:MAG: hypothetical protein COA90_09175 [Gammaproteobacteria bacterium]